MNLWSVEHFLAICVITFGWVQQKRGAFIIKDFLQNPHFSKYVMKSEIVIATTKQNSDGMHKKSLLKFWNLLFYSSNYIAYKEIFSYLDWDWILIW